MTIVLPHRINYERWFCVSVRRITVRDGVRFVRVSVGCVWVCVGARRETEWVVWEWAGVFRVCCTAIGGCESSFSVEGALYAGSLLFCFFCFLVTLETFWCTVRFPRRCLNDYRVKPVFGSVSFYFDTCVWTSSIGGVLRFYYVSIDW